MSCSESFGLFEARQRSRGVDAAAAMEAMDDLRVETPSWGYGDSGTRFKVFRKQGVPRNVFEKLDDAAQVNNLLGICPGVAIHIPWDKVDDFGALRAHAESLGLRLGAINPNLFQDDCYMFGSLCNLDDGIRAKAAAHVLECVEIARQAKSSIISLWLADGTHYPGQASLRARKHCLEESLAAIYRSLDPGMKLLIEYKPFEPAFYQTDIADWGMSYNFARKLGPRAQVLVDTGHHLPGANVEHIVAFLLDEERLGGFHFNSRKYADDDLIAGSINPYELFLIFYQILEAKRDSSRPGAQRNAAEIAYMIDQSHNIEPKIPAMIRSVLNVQFQYAKTLLINWEALKSAQNRHDVLGAEAEIREAFEQDPAPLLAAWREKRGLPLDPMKAFLESGYTEKIASRGVGGASW